MKKTVLSVLLCAAALLFPLRGECRDNAHHQAKPAVNISREVHKHAPQTEKAVHFKHAAPVHRKVYRPAPRRTAAHVHPHYYYSHHPYNFGRRIGGYPVYYRNGRPYSIGGYPVVYAPNGTLISIGGLTVSYSRGRMHQIGNMPVIYGYNNEILRIGNLAVSYDY